MPKVKIVQRKAQPQRLHEFNSKGQHRLVLVEETENKVSRWFEGHQVGSFEGYLFSAGQYPLQAGVFRQTMIEARVLTNGEGLAGGEMAAAQALNRPQRDRR